MKFFIRFGSYTLGSCVLGAAVCQTAAIKRSCFADPNEWDYNWDNLTDRGGIRHIVLIRHGQYNVQGCTDKDRVLTSIGKQQAEAVGICIAKISAHLETPIASVYCSSMTRAEETYDIARKSCCIEMPRAEISQDIAEGPPHAHDPPHPTWKPSPQAIEICQRRLDHAFQRHFHRPTTNKKSLEIFFCHANVTRYFLCKALQLPLNAWLRFNARHCSITWLTIARDGKVLCNTFGDTGFMENFLRTDQ